MIRSRLLLAMTLLASAVPTAAAVAACHSDSVAGTGLILVQNGTALPDGGVGQKSYAGAAFDEPRPAFECTTLSVGPCALRTCDPKLEGPVPHPPETAGVITLTGGLQTVTLTPQDGGYSEFFGERPLWTGGERITVQAAGADIGAFTASITAPAPVTVLSPTSLPNLSNGAVVYSPPDASACPARTGSTISRSRDLTIRWSGGTPSAVVQLHVFASGTAWSGIPPCPESAQGPDVTCTFDPAAGVGVVPASALSAISPGAVSVAVFVESSASVTPTGWPTTFIAESYALDPSGSVWGGGGVHIVYLQ